MDRMILFTAWKNVWRNKSRSLVVITSITIGVFAGVFAVGLMNGTIEQRMDAALNQEISYIQVNRKDFRENYDINLILNNIDDITSSITSIEGVEAVSQRTLITAIANTATKSLGVQLIGIDPEQDKKVFNLNEQLIPGTGSFFESDRSNLVYIGQDLAKELNVIRFRIEEATIEKLRSKKVPNETIEKLNPFIGKRFPSEKAFKKTLKKSLSARELHFYAKIILDEAWSFRERSKLTFTFLDKNNIQTGGMFRIAGIYDVKNSMFEKSQVFVRNEDLKRLTGLGKKDFHLEVIKLSDRDQTKEITEEIKAALPELQVQNWKELSPDLAMMSGLIEKFNSVFMLIILAALSFGIVNTMLMAVLERTKELGMLQAIGMNKKKIFTMIMTESIFLSLVGGVVGMIVSSIILLLTNNKGINFASAAEGLEAMGFSAHIYPTVTATFFVATTLLIVITGILSSIYPALKALKLDPADALRTE